MGEEAPHLSSLFAKVFGVDCGAGGFRVPANPQSILKECL
jgi:hypothetical protein